MSLGILKTVSKNAYQMALKKVNASRRVWKRHGKHSKRGSSLDVTKYKDPATNRDRAVVEIYRFQHRKSAKPFVGYLKGGKVTNWGGLRLCTVTKRSSGRSGFPDVTGRRTARVTVTARCIDGHTYVGRGPGDGMYMRMTPKRGR